jgi:hypothetical protein
MWITAKARRREEMQIKDGVVAIQCAPSADILLQFFLSSSRLRAFAVKLFLCFPR